MKRIKWFVVPLLMISIALFSYSLLEKRLSEFQQKLPPGQEIAKTDSTLPENQAWNTPTSKPPIISETVVITLTGYPKTLTKGWAPWEPMQNTTSFQGNIAMSNTNDEMYRLFQLLSGQNERISDARSMEDYTSSDTLFTLSNRYNYSMDFFTSLPNWVVGKSTLTLEEVEKNGLPSGPNRFTWLHIDAQRDQITLETLQKWIKNYQASHQPSNITSQLLLCYFPVSNTESISWMKNNQALSPFFYWSSIPQDKPVISPVTIQSEDITATLSFSLGLIPPVGCLGKPDYSWFSLDESSIMDRLIYHTDQFVYSTVYYLNQYQIEDSIIAGYLLESTDTIHATESANLAELERRYKVILDDFNSFQLYHQKQINFVPSFLWTLLTLLFLLIWLVNWLKRYRPYLFGTVLFLLVVLVQLVIFPGRLSYPVFSTITLWGLLVNHLLFLLPILSVLILSYTLMAGYWFNITFEEICHDINGILVTFSVFLLLAMTLWVTRYGFIFKNMMPPLGIQHNQNQFLSYWILMPVLLGYSYALSYGFSRLLISISHSRETNP